MSHTNSTTNYALPQFITTDKPAWLTDINNAFLAIDTGMDAAKDAADNAQNDATQALTDAGAAYTAATSADAKGAGAVASIEAAFDATAVYAVGAKVMYNSLLYRCTVAVVTPGPWTGSANWERVTVDSLIPADAASLPYGVGVTTKQAIDAHNTTVPVFSIGAGMTVAGFSCGKTDKLVSGSIAIDGSFTSGTWVVLGSIDVPPSATVYMPAVNATQGSHFGMIRIDPNGSFNFYPIITGSLRCAFTFGYITT